VLRADNLIQKAIDAFAAETGIRYGYDVEVDKRIPSPGGLGGASSDAASTLMALNASHGTPLPAERVTALAAKLGSDVPFFVGPPVALASGTGTQLEPLPTIRGWVILIVPRINITAKTATLYSALRQSDYTNGERVAEAAREIRNRLLPDPGVLENTFTRPLYDMEPELRALADRIIGAGAPHLKLSGAGPGHYVLLETEQEARVVAGRLEQVLPEDVLLRVVSIHTSQTSVTLQDQ
jgi:4-diphosphocytidyl-2-C-methyl-D-erythritol kinase